MAGEEDDTKPPLSKEELREAWAVLKEFAPPLSPEDAREVFDRLGGLEKVTLDLYGRLMREGNLELAAELITDLTARSGSPDSAIARENAQILAKMKHDS